MSTHIISRHYQRALSRWPVDLLRPEVSFQKAMQRRIDRRFLPSAQRPKDYIVEDKVQLVDERGELEQVNVLYSFLENRYTRKYPFSDKLMKPASNPAYYESLIQELQDAPQRSWLGSMINKWRGFLRIS